MTPEQQADDERRRKERFFANEPAMWTAFMVATLSASGVVPLRLAAQRADEALEEARKRYG